MESGSEGINVFGLLNSCRLFFLRPVEDRAEVKAVCGALLAAARNAYRALDVREFIVFATGEAMAEAVFEGGGCLISDGVRWVASSDLLQAWSSYIDEVLQARSHEVLSAAGAGEGGARTAIVEAGHGK